MMMKSFCDVCSLEEINTLANDYILLEDCGEYSKELEGYCIAISLDAKSKLIDIFASEDFENYKHVELLLNSREEDGLRIVYETMVKDYGDSVTNYLLRKFNNVDEIFDFYGYDSYEEVEEPDIIEQQQKEPSAIEESVITEQPSPQPVIQDDEGEACLPEELEEYISVIKSLDNSYPDMLLQNIKDMYNSGQRVKATNCLLEIIANLHQKGVI